MESLNHKLLGVCTSTNIRIRHMDKSYIFSLPLSYIQAYVCHICIVIPVLVSCMVFNWYGCILLYFDSSIINQSELFKSHLSAKITRCEVAPILLTHGNLLSHEIISQSHRVLLLQWKYLETRSNKAIIKLYWFVSRSKMCIYKINSKLLR